jgi:UDP-N-acetylmuramyl pentapeptide phosphotransferase/UDP-N-acetylglucosamine-1-phosphate transferase
MQLVVVALVAALVAFATLCALLASGLARVVLDHANARSMHRGSVPRVGGIGIAVAVAVALAFAGPSHWPEAMAPLAFATVAMLAVSLADDVRGLAAAPRLVAHLLIAALLAYVWKVPPLWLPVTTLVIAWGANLYNFMDGADGLAGGMTIFGYGVLALAALHAGATAVALACAAVAGATLGFLALNWHPARLFLGDGGSIPLGFAAAALSVLGAAKGHWPAVLPLIAFFPFVFDASVTLARRALAGAPLAQAHREHLYQRAALAGFGHRRVALGAYALMAVCALAALATLERSAAAGNAILCSVLALHLLAWAFVHRKIRDSEAGRTPQRKRL